MTILFVNLFLIYLLIGFLFALFFVFKGVKKIDGGAEGASWGFRLLILPGAMALWPILLFKWIRR